MKGLPYYTVRRGNGYWQPTAEMRRAGFLPVPCGRDGPEARGVATEANARWQEYRHSRRSSENVVALPSPVAADRMGYVYFLFVGDRVKVGFSTNPSNRMRELSTGLPRPPRTILMMRGRPRDERRLHAQLGAYRTNGEWFAVNQTLMRYILRLMHFDSLEVALRENDEAAA